MNKDQQTTIAGIVGALAIVAQWVATKVNIDLGITADLLGAITLLAGAFIAYKVGKKDSTKILSMIIAGLVLFPCVAMASGDKTFGWDAYTDNADGFKLYCARTANVAVIPDNLQATITPKTVTQYRKTGFEQGQWYCALTAYNATTESEKSNELSFTIPLDPVNNFKIIELLTMLINRGAVR